MEHFDIFLKLNGLLNAGTHEWKFPWGTSLIYSIQSQGGFERLCGQHYDHYELDGESKQWEDFLTLVHLNKR